ncbi:MAG: hypothetical protein ACR2PH_05930 [Desulfobulbia bacterium]
MDLYEAYGNLSRDQKHNILWEAIDFMQQYNGRSRWDCIALAMGWECEQWIEDGRTIYVEGANIVKPDTPAKTNSIVRVFAAMKNSDNTEGRGPMVVDELFTSKEDADKYIDQQLGLMGRKAEICGNKKPWSQQEYGDWQVKAMTLNLGPLTNEQKEKNKVRESALRKLEKLTDAERKELIEENVLNA